MLARPLAKQPEETTSLGGRHFFVTLKTMLDGYWHKRTDGKGKLLDFVLFLAAGKCKSNPFDDDFTKECLNLLRGTLGMVEKGVELEQGQCFRLKALSRFLELAGDPDWELPLELAGGVPLGVGKELPRTPAIYEAKVKWSLGDFDGEPETDRENYKTMVGYEDKVEELFREEAAQGWMEEIYDDDAKRIFQDRLHIASLAVIDEGKKIRVVHDASNGVGGQPPHQSLGPGAVPRSRRAQAYIGGEAAERPAGLCHPGRRI